MVSKFHTTYYCEQCGLELYSKGKLCPDCANEIRNRNAPPKIKKGKNVDDTPEVFDKTDKSRLKNSKG